MPSPQVATPDAALVEESKILVLSRLINAANDNQPPSTLLTLADAYAVLLSGLPSSRSAIPRQG